MLIKLNKENNNNVNKAKIYAQYCDTIILYVSHSFILSIQLISLIGYKHIKMVYGMKNRQRGIFISTKSI